MQGQARYAGQGVDGGVKHRAGAARVEDHDHRLAEERQRRAVAPVDLRARQPARTFVLLLQLGQDPARLLLHRVLDLADTDPTRRADDQPVAADDEADGLALCPPQLVGHQVTVEAGLAVGARMAKRGAASATRAIGAAPAAGADGVVPQTGSVCERGRLRRRRRRRRTGRAATGRRWARVAWAVISACAGIGLGIEPPHFGLDPGFDLAHQFLRLTAQPTGSACRSKCRSRRAAAADSCAASSAPT